MKLKQDTIGIGHNLKYLRKIAGFSQSQLARELHLLGFCHISVDIYKKMEQNKYNIRISELIAIRKVLNTRIDMNYNDFFADISIDEIMEKELS